MRIEVCQLDLYVSSEHGHRGRGLVGQPRWLQRCLFLIRSPPCSMTTSSRFEPI